MDANTYAAFWDELVKIAEGPNEQVNQRVAVNSSTHPLDQEMMNNSWEQKKTKQTTGTSALPEEMARESARQTKKVPKQSEPAKKANDLFGLPMSEPPKKNVRRYDAGGPPGASSPDRGQQPIDAQSTANIAAGNTMSPATGPGGV